jgi:hypothetical protein
MRYWFGEGVSLPPEFTLPESYKISVMGRDYGKTWKEEYTLASFKQKYPASLGMDLHALMCFASNLGEYYGAAAFNFGGIEWVPAYDGSFAGYELP